VFGQTQFTRVFQLSELKTVDEAAAKLLQFAENPYRFTTNVKRVATVSPRRPLVTVGFSFDDEPAVNSKNESTVATSKLPP